jgi:Protein of unknown function (DUF3631)
MTLPPPKICQRMRALHSMLGLVAEAYRADNITPAAVYHHLDSRPRTTLLVDEGDNLGLLTNAVLRSVFNSGHRRGGSVSRFVGGRSRRFSTFAPLAVAAIGTLPLPLFHRAVVVNLQRSGGSLLKRIDENDPGFAIAREGIQRWAARCTLEQDPEMPPALRDRAADNWRVLLAIADNLGYGEPARRAAVTLSANRPDEDLGETLLADIRIVFQASHSDVHADRCGS